MTIRQGFKFSNSLLTPRWDDIAFSSSAVNPSGSATSASIDGNSGAYLFVQNSWRTIAGLGQIPHGVVLPLELRAHIHWGVINIGNGQPLNFLLEFQIREVNDPQPFNFVSGWTNFTATVAAPTIAYTHELTSIAQILLPDYSRSAVFAWRFSRRGDQDNFNQNMILYSFDFHVQIADLGSPAEYGD